MRASPSNPTNKLILHISTDVDTYQFAEDLKEECVGGRVACHLGEDAHSRTKDEDGERRRKVQDALERSTHGFGKTGFLQQVRVSRVFLCSFASFHHWPLANNHKSSYLE